jgi:hypothetical protein
MMIWLRSRCVAVSRSSRSIVSETKVLQQTRGRGPEAPLHIENDAAMTR